MSALFVRHPAMSYNPDIHRRRSILCDGTIRTGPLIWGLAHVLHACYNKATMKTATIHARIEPDIKKKAEQVLRRLGLTPTEAIRIFYRQICLGNGLPFPVEIPNKQTAETLEKSQRGEEILKD